MNTITDIGRKIMKAELEYENGIPQWGDGKFGLLEYVLSYRSLSMLLEFITNAYSTQILTKMDVSLRIMHVYHNKVHTQLPLAASYMNDYEASPLFRYVFTINHFKMCKTIHGKIYNTLLWYLIDPLAMIADTENDISQETSDFFGIVKSNIEISDNHSIFCYWILGHLYIYDILVSDVMCTIMDFYIQDSLIFVNNLMDNIKSKLNM